MRSNVDGVHLELVDARACLDAAVIGQSAPASQAALVFAAGAVLFVCVLIAVALGPIAMLAMRARASGAPVQIADIIGMKLRKVDARLIVENFARANKAGLRIPCNKIETQYLAGGHVEEVVSAMILAREAKIDLPWDIATAIDLAGRDILATVQSAITPRVLTCPAPGGRHTSIEATSKDGVRFAVKAKVTVKTNIARLVGGATEETLLDRVAKGLQTIVARMDGRAIAEHQGDFGQWIIDSPVANGTAFEVLSVEVQVRQLG